MSTLRPYQQNDDRALVQGCIDGDEEAFAALESRYGRLIELVSVRALDEAYPGQVDTYPTLHAATVAYLKDNHAAPLRVFAGRSLPHFLSTVTRRVASDHLVPPTEGRPLVATLQTPSGIHALRDETPGLEMVGHVLERLPTEATCVLRLRARGLNRPQIAGALSRPVQSVNETLELLAHHLGRGLPNAVQAWRFILDAMTLEERTEMAVRSQDDERFRRHRAETELAYRALVSHILSQTRTVLPMCLDHHLLARWLDGSLSGDDRVWAEGHVTGCAFCTDSLALLLLDIEAVQPLREWSDQPPAVVLAAGSIASTRFLAGQTLAEFTRDPLATPLQRIARVGRHLTSGRSESRPPTIPPPPIAVSRSVPSDREAPVFAFEELARGRAAVAYSAVDEHLGKSPVGTRLKMLACAFGHDLDLGLSLAMINAKKPRVDPKLLEDAQAIRALPERAVLPREIQRERLRKLIPDLVRHVMASAE
jgi:hypothetical protein